LLKIGTEIGSSPVYLTQLFRQVEGLPLYRYHLRLRLARALELVPHYVDLTALALELGFSSHAHFTATFRQAYGRAPSEFKRTVFR
jgi:AraC family transcriptional regulator